MDATPFMVENVYPISGTIQKIFDISMILLLLIATITFIYFIYIVVQKSPKEMDMYKWYIILSSISWYCYVLPGYIVNPKPIHPLTIFAGSGILGLVNNDTVIYFMFTVIACGATFGFYSAAMRYSYIYFQTAWNGTNSIIEKYLKPKINLITHTIVMTCMIIHISIATKYMLWGKNEVLEDLQKRNSSIYDEVKDVPVLISVNLQVIFEFII